ncbi:MAG: HAMP domain-containing histidine kinase [Spirochaetes bacterium]|nr:HAMP domain-containing histidine kinase [Spirochaetota bacterium]
MKKQKSNDWLFTIFIFTISFIFCMLLFLIVRGQFVRADLTTQFELEQTFNLILEAERNGVLNEILEKEKFIIKFAIYDRKGNLITGYGDVKGHLDINRAFQNKKPSYNRHTKTVTIIRPFHKLPDHQPNMQPQMLHQNRPFKMGQKYLFLEIKQSHYFRSLDTSKFLAILFPVIFFTLVYFFYQLMRKNREFAKTIEQQQQLVKMGEVSRTLAHEIKNPLGAIKLQVAYLKKILPASHQTDFNIIEEETDRLSQLTTRINDFLRDPVGTPEKINVNQFIVQIISKLNFPIEFQPKNKQCVVYIDSHRFRSIIENLLINAYESYPEKSDHKEIVLEVLEDRDFIKIRISDQGKGLPADYEDKIFDPYFTTKTKGSGIGLAITKRFIEAAKGNIYFQHCQPQGTLAELIFPKQ